ncbi:MAG: N-acetyl-gamma-glutamyl-phosphate reductase [bacterium]
MFKVFVDGQEGTTGLRIFDHLGRRQDVDLLRITPDLRKDLNARRELLNRADVAFLCLPDAAARESAALVENPNTCVIDASTAFRTDPTWVYGLPELAPEQRSLLKTGKRIAVPGCHATAFVLLVHPLVASGVLPADSPVTCFSITGYSGGGKKLIAAYEGAEKNPKLDSPRPYALQLTHKHLPEMRVRSGLTRTPVFTPVVGPFYKGLAVTVFMHPHLLARRMAPAALYDLFGNYYAAEPFVRVMPVEDERNLDAGYFDVQGSNDTNRADLFVFGNEERVVLIGRLDNLGKGASGAAVQCMNVHLGIEETTGLR